MTQRISFLKRIREKVRRIIYGFLSRRKILKELQARTNNNLKNRNELCALLGAPALINDPEIGVFEKYAPLATEVIAEIGCAYGGSSLLFLLNIRGEAEVFSMDPFIKDSMGEFHASEKICRRHVAQALKDVGLGDRIKRWHLISDYSFNVVKTWRRQIDVLFIDGDHTYEAVKKDFEDWFPFVKNGGVIFFHDSRRPADAPKNKAYFGWPGPTQLVGELQGDPRLFMIDEVYSITVFRKR